MTKPVYTIWLCCHEFEQEDTREEAISMAAAYINGDHHTVFAVEGPDGEDLLPEAEAEADERSRKWSEQRREAPKMIGYVEVKDPSGKWWGRDYIYSEARRDEALAEYRSAYGQDRVRYVEQAGR
jgi:hypothetical protein